MANVPSAEKRNRQRLKRRARNLFHLTTTRSSVKRVRTALASGAPAGDVEAQLKAAVRLLDKAAQKGVLPKKTAARRVSRLTKAVQAAAKTSK